MPTKESLPAGALARLAIFCYRRRRLVTLAWVVLAAGIIALGFTQGAPTSNSFGGGSSESARAQTLLAQHFPEQSGGASITLAVHADSGVAGASTRTRIDALIARLRAAPHVTAVSDPYQTPGHISADGRTAFADAALDVNDDAMPPAETIGLVHDVRAATGGGVEFALGGGAVDIAESPGGGPADAIGMTAAMIVLLIAFGSVLAMALPIVTAVVGIALGLSEISLLNHVLPSPGFGPILAVMVGLGVGVDYALFIVTRYRETLAAGHNYDDSGSARLTPRSDPEPSPERAVLVAITAAGRAVLFAGGTVVIGLLGLLVLNKPILNGVAVGMALTVTMTMLAAVTLLPALLGFAGRGIDRLRVPRLGRGSGSRWLGHQRMHNQPLAVRWAGVIARRPVLAVVGAGAVLLILAAPTLGLRLSMPDESTQPHTTSGYATHRILAAGFGAGYDAPLVIVGPASSADPVAAAVRATPGLAAVSPARISTDGAVASIIAYPTSSAQEAATATLVKHLRSDVIPQAAPGAQVLVGGPVAGTVDFASMVASGLPLLITVVVALSLFLLIAIFRSVVLAVKAALLNLISIGAAYGVLVAAIQWGWLTGVLGFPGAMPIAAFVPLIMFPVLFGLSMDYEVFLVSRIREAYDQIGNTRTAVAAGLSSTARVITAAAAIMVVVFLSVMFGADLAVKQLGLGLATMVLVDATLVRMVLVPAAMELFGRANWWLPGWLDRLLPKVATEAPAVEPPTPTPALVR